MRWVLRGVILVLVLLIGSALHYTLPQTDIVRIVGAGTKRIDFGENSFFWQGGDVGGAVGSLNHDVFFVETIKPNNRPMVYRNEDTGWGWPPYFKFNSYDVQATASSMISQGETAKWVAVKHYGWRNEFFSIFPNVISIKPVAGPDVKIVPWGAIVILVLLLGLVVLVWRMLAQFRERMIDPMVDKVGDSFDEMDARAEAAAKRARGRWARFKAWISGKS